MKLSQTIPVECITVDLDFDANCSKEEILAALLELLIENCALEKELSREEAMTALLQREKEQTTALGEGFAFPHARFQNLHNSYTVIGICRDGVGFNSLDSEPTNFFILSLVPASKACLLLQSRAAIMRFLMPELTRKAVLEAKKPKQVWEMLDSSDIEVNHDILAKDIMRPQVGELNCDDTLLTAARTLHKYHIDSLPVLDKEGKLIKEISCYDLFAFGLPDFFFNLKKISFVKHIDPFEKYFQVDHSLKITEITCRKKTPIIAPDATLIEIVFELTTKDNNLVYVVDKHQKLLGVIDRFSIVDKILVQG